MKRKFLMITAGLAALALASLGLVPGQRDSESGRPRGGDQGLLDAQPFPAGQVW